MFKSLKVLETVASHQISSLNKSGLSFLPAVKSVTKLMLKTTILQLILSYHEKYWPKHSNKVSLASYTCKTAIFENCPIMRCELFNKCISCMLMVVSLVISNTDRGKAIF